jgi:transposase
VSRYPRRRQPTCWPRCGARYGDGLALHLLLVCAAGHHPTDIAAVPFCSRSRVYRTVRASRAGTLGLVPDDDGRLRPPVRPTGPVPTLRQSLLALRKAPPRAYAWCRTRWSCATWAAPFKATRGLTESAETMRRWVHEVGWVWKRAKLVAQDDDPPQVERLARLRFVYEPLPRWEASVCADELAIHGRPKGGRRGGRKAPRWRSCSPGPTKSTTWLAP